jgi:hypothetical protein
MNYLARLLFVAQKTKSNAVEGIEKQLDLPSGSPTAVEAFNAVYPKHDFSLAVFTRYAAKPSPELIDYINATYLARLSSLIELGYPIYFKLALPSGTTIIMELYNNENTHKLWERPKGGNDDQSPG